MGPLGSCKCATRATGNTLPALHKTKWSGVRCWLACGDVEERTEVFKLASTAANFFLTHRQSQEC